MHSRKSALLLASTAVLPLYLINAASAQEQALPEITITAPAGSEFNPSAVDKDQIQSSGGASLGDVLFDKPGITSTTFAPGAASRPVVRGLDSFRVKMQENGTGAGDVSDLGADHAVPIDPLAAEKLEIIRGPQALRYGSQVGGVVNATNNRIPEVPYLGLQTQFRGAFSTVDHATEGAVIVDAGNKDFTVHADSYGRGSSDYRIPGYPYLNPTSPAPAVNGRQLNSAAHSEGQAVGGSYFFNGGFAGMSVSHFTSIYHVPGLESAAAGTRIKMEQTKINGKAEWHTPFGLVDTVKLSTGVSDYHHAEIGVGEDGIDATQAVFKNQEQEARLEMLLQPLRTPLGPLTSTVGTQVNHQQLGTSGDAAGLLAPAETISAAAFMLNELKLTDMMKMQLAGRVERVKIDGMAAVFPSDFLGGGADPALSSATRSFTPKSVSLALLHDLPWNMIGSVTGSYAERAPRATELFAKGSHDASGTFEIGNADLKPEAAKTAEIGVKRTTGSLRFEANAYYTQYDGFIYSRLTGNTCGADFQSCVVGSGGGEFRQIVYSQQNATFRGAEASAQYDLRELGTGMLGVDAQYDIVRATFADGTNVPRMPPQRIGGGVWWRDSNWYTRVGLLHAFGQNDISGFETTTGGYNLLKAEVSYTTKLAQNDFGMKEMKIGVIGTNLLNEEIRNSVSFRKDEVLLPGAGVKLFANFTF